LRARKGILLHCFIVTTPFMTDDQLQAYADAHSEPEPPLLHKLWRETHLQLLMPRMATGHWQGRLLSMLSHLIKPRRVLEIGTFTGYATLCLAEGLAQDGRLHTIEINPERESRIRRYVAAAGLTEQVHLHIGDARDILADLVGEVWDLVFIDADKINNGQYFDLVINQVRPGGLLIVDNVLWGGKALPSYPLKGNDHDSRAVRAFNEQVRHDSRVVPLLLPVRDGLLLLRRV
jgi:caffeoyl-CoA O-methyltransferase